MKSEIMIRQTCHVSYVVISATPTSFEQINIHTNSLYKANQNAVFITSIQLFWSVMS
jgi:hypothetical protein